MPSPERSRRLTRAAILFALFLGSFLAVRAITGELAKAELNAEQDLPPDVQAELDETWDRFARAFAEHRTCFGDVTVRLVRILDGADARYVRADGVIEIKIPTSPRRFRESLVHELAHHVELTCPDHVRLRERLGHDDASWARDEEWESVPAERWAEAVVQLVNGERVRFARTMPLDDAWIAEIDDWIATG